jgi:hypothetical protein
MMGEAWILLEMTESQKTQSNSQNGKNQNLMA